MLSKRAGTIAVPLKPDNGVGREVRGVYVTNRRRLFEVDRDRHGSALCGGTRPLERVIELKITILLVSNTDFGHSVLL